MDLSRPGGRLIDSAASRGLRFALSGAGVAGFYIALTTLLAEGVGLSFQLALAVGFASAVSLHFILQRVFVWVHADGFALTRRRQLGRYLAVAAAQYLLTAAIMSAVPGWLDAPETLVYLVTAVVLAALNFLILGGRVFHKGPTAPPSAGS